VWDGPTDIPHFLPSFWSSYAPRAACNYWEHWPLASWVRLALTESKNKRKSGGRAKPLDLEFLATVPFDTTYVLNPMVVSERALFCCGLCADLEPTHVLCRSIPIEGPPWECATSEANLAEGCRSPRRDASFLPHCDEHPVARRENKHRNQRELMRSKVCAIPDAVGSDHQDGPRGQPRLHPGFGCGNHPTQTHSKLSAEHRTHTSRDPRAHLSFQHHGGR
jgi:hypothetical protein